ncbi:MAG: (d)CMP kinase [Pseudomonadota bacterium]
MIIAIDGPAASGKGTLARKLAEHFNIAYLDTGSLYRAVALRLVLDGADPKIEEKAVEAARQLDGSLLGDPRLRSGGVGEAASVVAANPRVREEILDFQRRYAATPGGAVLDGRDIGTIVCPDADVKLFVIANPEVRARRRFEELRASGEEVTYDTVLADLRARDARDEGRAIAPLKPASDALLLDTSELDIETAFRKAVTIVEGRMDTQ